MNKKNKCLHSTTKNISSHKVVNTERVTQTCTICNALRYVSVTPIGGKHYSRWFKDKTYV